MTPATTQHKPSINMDRTKKCTGSTYQTLMGSNNNRRTPIHQKRTNPETHTANTHRAQSTEIKDDIQTYNEQIERSRTDKITLLRQGVSADPRSGLPRDHLHSHRIQFLSTPLDVNNHVWRNIKTIRRKDNLPRDYYYVSMFSAINYYNKYN